MAIGDVIANRIKIHYTRTGGAKTALVLNHGATDNGLCWTPVARALEANYDVIMPDARGHGLSAAPEEGYGAGQQAADLAGLITALEFDGRPSAATHGRRGDAALRGGLPDMLRCAILEDPGFRPPMRRPGRAARARWRARARANRVMS